jgi:hypothetical protein
MSKRCFSDFCAESSFAGAYGKTTSEWPQSGPQACVMGKLSGSDNSGMEPVRWILRRKECVGQGK